MKSNVVLVAVLYSALIVILLGFIAFGFYTQSYIKNHISFVHHELKQTHAFLEDFNNTIDDKLIILVSNTTSQALLEQKKDIHGVEEQLNHVVDELYDEIDDLRDEQDDLEDDIDDLEDDIEDIPGDQKQIESIASYGLQHVVKISAYNKKNEWQHEGSGFFTHKNGYIATNAHVVLLCDIENEVCSDRDIAPFIKVKTIDEQEFEGRIVGYNQSADIAVIQINTTHSVLQWAHSAYAQQGETVVALGHPLHFEFSVTAGVLSAIRYENNVQYIQFDAPITFGNSGGPLLDINARVLGINTLTFEPGLNFAIGSQTAEPVISALISQDQVDS